MSDKRIEPISDDLQNKNPPNKEHAETTLPSQQPPTEPLPSLPSQPSATDLAPQPQGSSPTEPQQESTDATPKPFTMDDPTQVASEPTQEQAPANDVAPKPFTMDDPLPPASTDSSPDQQTAPSDFQDSPSSTQASVPAAGTAQVINPQQSAPLSQSSEPQLVNGNEAVGQASVSLDSAVTSQGANPSIDSPQANQAAQAVRVQPATLSGPPINADGTPASSSQVAAAQSQSMSSSQEANGNNHGKKTQKLPLLIGGVIFALVATLGFVFGYYLPNRPENVYSAGLERTGDVIEEMILQATEQEQLELLSRLEVSGDMVVMTGDTTFEGELLSFYEEGASDSSLKISFSGDEIPEDLDIGIDLITDMADGRDFPDIFFRIRGFEVLGAEAFLPGVNAFDNRWIHIDADYIKEITEAYDIEDESLQQVTLQDYIDYTRDVVRVTNEYFFSVGDNAIFQRDEITGQERFDDISTFGYKVSVQRENAQNYCDAVADVTANSSLVQNFENPDEQRKAQIREDAKESCQEMIDELANQEVTMWIDRRTKLIHKVRFNEPETPDSFVEIGQKYTGGDDITIFARAEDSEDGLSGYFEFIANVESSVSTSRLQVNQNDANSQEFSLEINLESKPLADTREIERPSSTTSIDEVLEALMGNMFQPEPDSSFNEFDFETPPTQETQFIETMSRFLL